MGRHRISIAHHRLCPGWTSAATYPESQVRFLQLTLLVSGTFCIIQSLWGTAIPPRGPGHALLLTFIGMAHGGIQTIQGGLLLGGLLLATIGTFRVLRTLMPFFTPTSLVSFSCSLPSPYCLICCRKSVAEVPASSRTICGFHL